MAATVKAPSKRGGLWSAIKAYRNRDPVGLLVRFVLLLVALLLVVSSQVVGGAGVAANVLLTVGASLATFTMASSLDAIFEVDVASHYARIDRRLDELTAGISQLGDGGLVRMHSGVVSIDPDLGQDEHHEFRSFGTATTIDMLYNTGKTTIRSYGQRLYTAASKGAHLRLLLSDPAGPISIPEVNRGLCPGTNIAEEIREVTETLIDWCGRLGEKGSRPNIELRYFSCVPSCSIVIVDQTWARVTPYLPYVHSQSAPIFHLSAEHGFLFDEFRSAFERVWEQARAIPMERPSDGSVVEADG